MNYRIVIRVNENNELTLGIMAKMIIPIIPISFETGESDSRAHTAQKIIEYAVYFQTTSSISDHVGPIGLLHEVFHLSERGLLALSKRGGAAHHAANVSLACFLSTTNKPSNSNW